MEGDIREVEGRGQPEVEIAEQPAFNAVLVAQGDRVEISKGVAGLTVADEATVEAAASLVTVARSLRVQKGGSQWLVAGDARLEQSGAGIVLARNVNAPDAKVGVMVGGSTQGNMDVGVLLAGRVEGNVQALVDTAAALRFGAAFGGVLGVFLLLSRLIGRR